MFADALIVKAAWHEASHIAVAHAFQLPIAEVWIEETGGGHVSYTRRFHYAEIEVWVIATLAGGIVERGRWGSAADGGDLKAIANMVRDMGITPWNDAILGQHRHAAERFVREKRDVIQIVAEELLCRLEMSGSELDTLLSSLSQIEV